MPEDQVVDVFFNVYKAGEGAVWIGFASEAEARAVASKDIIARVRRKMVFREGEDDLLEPSSGA